MGWDKSRSNLTSTKVEFEVEDGLGKIRCTLVSLCLFLAQNYTFSVEWVG